MRRKFDVKAYQAEMQRSSRQGNEHLFQSVTGSVKGSDYT